MLHKRVKAIFDSHREHLLTVAFVCGFIVDNLTLNRVDQLFDNLILLTYVTLAMMSLLVLYAATADKLPERMSPFLRKWSPMLTQYAFGGLLSGMLIFYGRSGSWLQSWPFLLVILLVIVGNETIKDRVQRFLFNLAILFVGLFSYVVLVVPVLTGTMGPIVFVGSGVLALIIMLVFVRVLALIIPRFIGIHQRSLIFIFGLIFAFMNFLYFANIIPPIPLSLKDVGIYHSVVKFDNGDYQLRYEEPKWWEKPFRNSDSVFHSGSGDNLFCFASVFAPTRFALSIYHRWEYFDETTKQWVEHARLSYDIEGGRGSGYRGYTLVKSYSEGKWRCSVETERGQVLGREEFRIENGQPGELITRVE